jgi:hypothetical protein
MAAFMDQLCSSSAEPPLQAAALGASTISVDLELAIVVALMDRADGIVMGAARNSSDRPHG